MALRRVGGVLSDERDERDLPICFSDERHLRGQEAIYNDRDVPIRFVPWHGTSFFSDGEPSVCVQEYGVRVCKSTVRCFARILCGSLQEYGVLI